MMGNPVPPNLVMSVRLEAVQWNTVLGVLGKQPYEIIALIIEAMQQQLQAQAVAPAGGASDQPGNGIDRASPHEPAMPAAT